MKLNYFLILSLVTMPIFCMEYTPMPFPQTKEDAQQKLQELSARLQKISWASSTELTKLGYEALTRQLNRLHEMVEASDATDENREFYFGLNRFEMDLRNIEDNDAAAQCRLELMQQLEPVKLKRTTNAKKDFRAYKDKSERLGFESNKSVQLSIERFEKKLGQRQPKKELKRIRNEIREAMQALEKMDNDRTLADSLRQFKLEQTSRPSSPLMHRPPSTHSTEEFQLPVPLTEDIAVPQQPSPPQSDLSELSNEELLARSVINSQESHALLARIHYSDQQDALEEAAYQESRTGGNNNRQKSYRKPLWTRGFTFLGSASIFATIGLYSCLKLAPEKWYRPWLLGTSIIGGSLCTALSIKHFLFASK